MSNTSLISKQNVQTIIDSAIHAVAGLVCAGIALYFGISQISQATVVLSQGELEHAEKISVACSILSAIVCGGIAVSFYALAHSVECRDALYWLRALFIVGFAFNVTTIIVTECAGDLARIALYQIFTWFWIHLPIYWSSPTFPECICDMC